MTGADPMRRTRLLGSAGALALLVLLLASPAGAEDPPTPGGSSPSDAPPPAAPPLPPPGPDGEAPPDGEGPVPPGGIERVTLHDIFPDAPAGRVLPLGATEAVRMALAANIGLESARYDPLIAQSGYTAEVAQFDTLLTAEFGYAHTETPATSSFFGTSKVTEDSFVFDAGVRRRLHTGGTIAFLYHADRLTTDNAFFDVSPRWTQGPVVRATQPILRGAGDVALADIRRAQNGVVAAHAGLDTAQEQVLLDALLAYWELVYAQEQVMARRKSEEVADELLQDSQARLDARVGTPLDVADARAGVEQRRGERIGAEGARQAASDRLREVILPFDRARSAQLEFFATENLREQSGTRPEEEQIERYVQIALQNRPEMRGVKAELGNRGIDIMVAADGVRPQLDVLAEAGSTGLTSGYGSAFEDAWTGEAVSARIGLQFSLFLGQRAARANLRIAQWARRQSLLRQREIENDIVAQVRAAVRDMLTSRARLQAAVAEERASLEGLEGERDRLAQGKSTPFRVLEKEEDLTDARTRAARAASDLRQAEAALWRSVGMLSETYGIDCSPCR